ncbi:MAG: DUF924 family protein [Polyangiales bacterium]
MNATPPTPADIVRFWREAGPRAWFAKDDAFDARCRAFEAAHHAAARRELDAWEATPEGALALCLLLDQFPRNLYRASGHAFATDPLARAIADRAIAAGHDRAFDVDLRAFFYLPFEHAEDAALQARSVALFEATGNAEYVRFAALHRDLIARFGRFPHRNRALGRTSTPEEEAFLAGGGFAG